LTSVSEGFSSKQYSQIMHDHLEVLQDGFEECMCVCPFCFGRSLQFNVSKGVWICFKCGESGSAKKLVEMLQGTYMEPEADFLEISRDLRALAAESYEAPQLLPESMLLRYRHRTQEPHRLWLARGFDKAVCDLWELGFDPLADNGGALTLPYRNPATGHLDGIIFRNVNPAPDQPRYRFPKGFPRSRSIYGSWLVDHMLSDAFPTFTVTEGPTDAIRVSQAGFMSGAQYGSSISAGQIRLLHRMGVHDLVLFYDYDRAGLRATEKGTHLAEEFNVSKVLWDKDKYCWHGTVCGCHFGQKHKDIWIAHTSNGNCPSMRKCKCGRVHEPDPCSLELEEIRIMHEGAVEV